MGRAHRCTSAGRLTSVCNGQINKQHSGPRWSVTCLSLGCRHLPAASDRLGCVASVGTATGRSSRPLDWSAEVESSVVVLSLLHLCFWCALVQYVLYLLFVACPGTMCLVFTVCGVPWYNMYCTYCFISLCNFLFILKVFYCLFSYTAQYFSSLYGSRVLFTCTAEYVWFSYTAQYLCSFILLNTSFHCTGQEFCSLALPNKFGPFALVNTFV